MCVHMCVHMCVCVCACVCALVCVLINVLIPKSAMFQIHSAQLRYHQFIQQIRQWISTPVSTVCNSHITYKPITSAQVVHTFVCMLNLITDSNGIYACTHVYTNRFYTLSFLLHEDLPDGDGNSISQG